MPQAGSYPGIRLHLEKFFTKNATAILTDSAITYNKVDKRQTLAYSYHMKYLNWNSEKNDILKRERGISFEEIAYLIESGQVIGIEENPGYPNQKMYVLEIDNYAIIVPYVENDDEIFLKTAFPSRKYTKKYGLKGE